MGIIIIYYYVEKFFKITYLWDGYINELFSFCKGNYLKRYLDEKKKSKNQNSDKLFPIENFCKNIT